MADESKPVKAVYSWWVILWTWAMQVYFVFYISTLRWFVSLLLVLTPTLWGPRLWFAVLGASMTEQPVYLGDIVIDTLSQQDSDGRCKTWTEKREAITNSALSASGWYGPGAYLAWLITAYATALSNIWHSKCSEKHPDVNKLDAEILLTIGYPLVALCDVLLRLIRCQIDPGMTAAVFVLVSTLTIIGPLTRLSWQEDDMEIEIDPHFPRTVKEWTWKTFRFLCHTIVYAVLSEPYLEPRVLLAVYILLNGIRCSITDLSPPTTRILPTVYSQRFNISLYDAQYDSKTGNQIPIPRKVINAVVAAILRFQIVCLEVGVPASQMLIIATEATRKAINSEEFVKTIQNRTHVRVLMLPKDEEGVVGAWGIASGFSDIEGLAIDLGGGSMQMTWIISHAGDVRISSKGSISFPYGAAALTQKLEALTKGKDEDEAAKAKEQFRQEMTSQFRRAWDDLEIPEQLVDKAKKEGGFQLYLSGGGFRGWGYLLLYLHQIRGEYYPISIINGYTAGKKDFENTEVLKKVAQTANDIFRVSDRRRKQVPSVAFLVNVLAKAIPHGIKEAHFCQGGVREGALYRKILPVIRQQDPLQVATMNFARGSAQAMAFMAFSSIPRPTKDRSFPHSISPHVIQAFANILYAHATMSKETAATAALYSTSTGVLAEAHGIPHADRARLALMLQERYGGELPPREMDFKKSLRSLLTPEEIWWTRYLGKLGLVISRVYPTGVIDPSRPRALPRARWANDLGKKKNKQGIELKVLLQKVGFDPTRLKQELEADLKKLRKVGKRKHWIGGRDGWGMKVKVILVEEDLL
ncbi:Ppx/GppA phosphatase family-domain-containing protein [Aspergillus transmontanensis]|uniref:Ppx/GppA phosphatase family-domain-containing protein n=1 Tax=Aspergillus transmontanensis TaxID=1034304 RepID=A0A5N6VX13_9EURO|nr:Ppx/GppA phosphatase family-domain-containing protein [Aspergillus transmontanensis]